LEELQVSKEKSRAAKNGRKAIMKKGYLIFGALGLCLLFAPQETNSATVLKFNTKQMTARAHKIVYGVVESKVSRSLSKNSQQIYTEYTIKVTETWKNSKIEPVVTFKQLGGKVGDRGYFIAGAASYDVGEEVVVFLDRANPVNGCCFTIGLAQGKYRVEMDKLKSQKLVSRFMEKLELIDSKTRKPAAAHSNTKGLLSALKGEVVKALTIKENR
jgi:hypothetical protein